VPILFAPFFYRFHYRRDASLLAFNRFSQLFPSSCFVILSSGGFFLALLHFMALFRTFRKYIYNNIMVVSFLVFYWVFWFFFSPFHLLYALQ